MPRRTTPSWTVTCSRQVSRSSRSVSWSVRPTRAASWSRRTGWRPIWLSLIVAQATRAALSLSFTISSAPQVGVCRCVARASPVGLLVAAGAEQVPQPLVRGGGDRQDMPAGVGGQPARGGLRRGEERLVQANVGVDAVRVGQQDRLRGGVGVDQGEDRLGRLLAERTGGGLGTERVGGGR